MGIANINKKTIGKSILIITLILLLSSIAYAKPFTDAFRGGLLQINDFFAKEQYKPYSQVIDFFFFSLLFIAIYLMGVRYAFKEVKRPEQVIAILLGLMTAFLLVLGGFSLTILLPYMQWILYVLLFILYWWLLKGIKNKFWRFVLALLLTLLTIALFQGLFDSLTAPDAEGFFKSLGKGFGAIQFPELPGPPGVPSYLTDLFGAPTAAPTGPDLTTLPSTTTPASEAPGKGGIFGTGTSWWWVLLPLILALATGGGIFAHRKGWLKWPRRGERPAGEEPAAAQPTPPTTPEELTIQKIVDEMIEIIKIKQEILKVVDGIVRYKKAKIKDLHDEYMKVLKYDRSFWVDTESEAFQSFLAQQHVIKTILKLEFDLEKLLIQLMEKENQITGFGKYSNEAAMRIGAERRPIKVGLAGIWLRRVIELDRERARELIQELDRIEKEDPLLFWEKVRAKIEQWLISLRNAPYWYRELMAKIYGIFFRLFTKSHGTTLGLCWAVKQKIAEYFIIGKNERYKLKAWEKLTEIKTLQKWYRDKSKWKTIDKTNPEAIKRHFENEEKFFFEQLRPAILAQMKYMYLLTRYLKLFLANREKFTEMQELWLEFQDFISWYPRRLTKEEAANPENALLIGMPFTVKTKMARGVNGDYKALFYIDGQVVLDPNTGRPYEKTITKSDEIQFPDIELMSQEVTRYRTLLAGEHEATIYIIGPLDPNTGRPILEESPETPIAAKYRDVKSIKFWLIEPNVGIQITMPIEQSSHIIGRTYWKL
ncbi:hypothetical protein HYX04_01430 [Candidatus Woesearchaeota archaeon]|nr:hypothetical protein [Candidatus Woesearchaeota archaeon]